ncbi:MAG: metal ABC transporter solute-binding protein, Zn/Mn family, partial [Acidimicrobiales bacterium]
DHAHDDDDHGHSHDDDHAHDDDDHGHSHDDDHAHDDDDHGHDHDDDHAHDGDDHGHDHGDEDPHIWQDPARMSDAMPGIADAIVEAVPSLDADAVRERAEAYAAELLEVDAEIEEILSAVPSERRYLITNHDTFGYLADRYGFEVIGTVIPGGDTLAAPSAADLAELVAEIEEHDLPAIFADNTVAPGLTQALADEASVDVEVVTLYTDSLGEPGSDADTYIGMLRTNAQLIADALS